jgi:cupin 2 domain-containing protein
MSQADHLWADLPRDLHADLPEVVDTLLSRPGIRIERICSRGHSAPPDGGWFDSEEDEWVLVLQGAGRIAWPDGRSEEIRVGEHLFIPARERHRVAWTDPDRLTIWLAVFVPPVVEPQS